MKFGQVAKKIWWFIWEDNSVWSWAVNIILAFVLIKFLFYPGIGLLLGTTHPIVAVVSYSMEHNTDFDSWWTQNGQFYSNLNITKQEFSNYKFKRGFNKGDIMVLKGVKPKDIKAGDVIVFRTQRPDPIIHRVVREWKESNNYFFQTKGDNNRASIKDATMDETKVSEQQVIGRAVVKIPWLGWVKILFVEAIQFVGNIFV